MLPVCFYHQVKILLLSSPWNWNVFCNDLLSISNLTQRKSNCWSAEARKNISKHWLGLVTGECSARLPVRGVCLVIVMVRNLDNFSNSLEQISCENKPVGENWKFIISYQWFSLSQQCGVITRWCVSCLLSSWLMPLIKCDNHNS